MPPRRWADVFDDWLVGRLSFSDWLLASLARPDNFPAYLSVLVTVILAFFAFIAWLDTRQQLDLLRAQQRPWIYYKKPEIQAWTKSLDHSNGKTTLQFMVRFNITNSGKTPGEALRSFSFLDLPGSAPADYHKDDEELSGRCEDIRSEKAPAEIQSPTIYGQVVFPNQEAFQVMRFDFDYGVIDKRLRSGEGDVLIVGCGDYGSPIDNLHHQTRFAFKIRLKDRIDPGHEIEAKDLEMVISPYFRSIGD